MAKKVEKDKLKKAEEDEEGEGGGQGGGPETEDDEDEGEGDEDEKGGKVPANFAKKSEDLTQDDLEKSLNKLEAYVADGDKPTRKAQLLEKAQSGELAKSERDELFQILGGGTPAAEGLGAKLVKGLEDNETLAKALDVSDYLQEQHTELCKSLDALGEHIEKSDSRQHEFNLVLAKAVADIGGLAKAMSERLEVIEGQPVRGPKSRGVSAAAPLEKSFGGQKPGAAGEEFSKSQILDGMQDLLEKSVDSGQGGAVPGIGDMGVAISKFEQFNTMHPQAFQLVREHLNSKRVAQ